MNKKRKRKLKAIDLFADAGEKVNQAVNDILAEALFAAVKGE